MNTYKCLCCGKENSVKKNCLSKYCDNACQAKYQFTENILPRFLLGDVSNRRTLHKIMKHLHGYSCASCGNEGSHNGLPLSLQLDHIDGNAGHNMPENLRLLCPNCHSQTDTFVAKNKGKGRQARGLSR
jgi:5-methylcytosine-specific restriction endonuclease McrA